MCSSRCRSSASRSGLSASSRGQTASPTGRSSRRSRCRPLYPYAWSPGVRAQRALLHLLPGQLEFEVLRSERADAHRAKRHRSPAQRLPHADQRLDEAARPPGSGYFITAKGPYIYYNRLVPQTASNPAFNDGVWRVDTKLGPPLVAGPSRAVPSLCPEVKGQAMRVHVLGRLILYLRLVALSKAADGFRSGIDLVGACATAQAGVLTSSTFDSGTDGWLTMNGAVDLTLGRQRRRIRRLCDGHRQRLWSDAVGLVGSESFLGDKSSAVGGTFVVLSTRASERDQQ